MLWFTLKMIAYSFKTFVDVVKLPKRATQGDRLATKIKVNPHKYSCSYGKRKQAYKRLYDAGALVVDDAQVRLKMVVSVAFKADVPDGLTADLLKQFARHAGNMERNRDIYSTVGDVVAAGARSSAICEKFSSQFRLANGDELRERRLNYMYILSTSVDQPVVPHTTIVLSGYSLNGLYADILASVSEYKQIKIASTLFSFDKAA